MMEWIEQTADGFTWMLPCLAMIGLWIVRTFDAPGIRLQVESIFYMLLMLVAGGTLRTICADDPCWFLHSFSLGIMVVGAIIPRESNSLIEEFSDALS